MIVELKPLSSLSFAAAVELWNEGFQGYSVDLSMSLNDYLARLHTTGVSIEKSLVAKLEGRPVGFLMNAIRHHAGQLVAWNGGTGVIPEFRSQGVGRVLVAGALKIYAEAKVDYATLEAISTNEPAIALYKSCGYDAVDELTFLQHTGKLDIPFDSADYVVEEVTPGHVSQTSFYDACVPWQAHWQSVNDNCGQAIIVYDTAHSPIGYALFRKQFEDDGDLKAITLHQCVAAPSRPDHANIISCALSYLFSPLSVDCLRSTHNFKKSNQVAMDLLKRAGFKTFVEQVWMKKVLK